jgi:hypothetical protein
VSKPLKGSCATRATKEVTPQRFTESGDDENVLQTDRRIADIAFPVCMLTFLVHHEYEL